MGCPSTAEVGAETVTARSADVCTVLIIDAALLREFGSGIALAADTVLVTVDPEVAEELKCAMIRKAAELPAVNIAMFPLMVPEPPADGVISIKAGPVVCVAETNVRPEGNRSEK